MWEICRKGEMMLMHMDVCVYVCCLVSRYLWNVDSVQTDCLCESTLFANHSAMS